MIGGLGELAQRAATRRGAQAGPLLLRRLRLARADRRDGRDAAPGRRRRWRRAASGRWTSSAATATRARATCAWSRRAPWPARTPWCTPIDVTGLGTRGRTRSSSRAGEIQRTVPGREALSMIAAETGGRFFRNANDLGAGAGRDGADDQPLLRAGLPAPEGEGPGRVPQGQGGGGAARRERLPPARVLREGARWPAQTVLQRQFEAAQLVMTGAGANDLKFSALCLPVRAPGEKQTLGVVLQIPKEALAWNAGHPIAAGGLRLRRRRGRHRRRPLRAARARRSRGGRSARAPVHGLSFFGTLALPPGKYTIRLMVQDRDRGAAGRAVPGRDRARAYDGRSAASCSRPC